MGLSLLHLLAKVALGWAWAGLCMQPGLHMNSGSAQALSVRLPWWTCKHQKVLTHLREIESSGPCGSM